LQWWWRDWWWRECWYGWGLVLICLLTCLFYDGKILFYCNELSCVIINEVVLHDLHWFVHIHVTECAFVLHHFWFKIILYRWGCANLIFMVFDVSHINEVCVLLLSWFGYQVNMICLITSLNEVMISHFDEVCPIHLYECLLVHIYEVIVPRFDEFMIEIIISMVCHIYQVYVLILMIGIGSYLRVS